MHVIMEVWPLIYSDFFIAVSDKGLSLAWRRTNLCSKVNWTLRNKLKWNLNRNAEIIIQGNAFGSITYQMSAILFMPQWVYIRLQWRHSERHGVSNHQHLDCLLIRLFRRTSKEIIKAPPHFSTIRASSDVLTGAGHKGLFITVTS